MLIQKQISLLSEDSQLKLQSKNQSHKNKNWLHGV